MNLSTSEFTIYIVNVSSPIPTPAPLSSVSGRGGGGKLDILHSSNASDPN